MMFIHQITFKILGKLTESWNIGNDNLYKLCSQRLGNADHSTKYNIHPSNSLQYVKQYQWTVKDRSLFSGQYLCHRLVISKYDIHPSNTLQVTRQNHWLIKYVMLTYIYNVKGHVSLTHYPKVLCLSINWSWRYTTKPLDCEIWVTELNVFKVKGHITLTHFSKIWCYDDDEPSNTFKNIRQNHWTMKYRSLLPTLEAKGYITPSHYSKVWHSSTKLFFRYKAKSQDHEI